MPTNEPLQGFQLPTPDDPAAIPDDLARLTGDLISIATPRFATAAQRDAAYPSPTDGQHVWVDADKTIYVRSSGAWVRKWGESDALRTGTPSLTGVPDGWTVTATGCVRRGGVCQLELTATGPVLAQGNISNITIGVLPVGFRPMLQAQLSGGGSDAAGAINGHITTGGSIQITDTLFDRPTGATLLLRSVYLHS